MTHKMARVVHDEIPSGVARRPFTVAEYYRMAEAGILSEDDRVELIAGEVVTMSPIGSQHAAVVDRLTGLCVSQAGARAIVRVQGPVRLDDYSEPEPDVSLLRPRADFYSKGHPGPADVLLIIEVADTSLAYDRTVKMRLYARSGIAEAFLVDIGHGLVTQYTRPIGGVYKAVRRARKGQSLTSASVPALRLAVAEILG